LFQDIFHTKLLFVVLYFQNLPYLQHKIIIIRLTQPIIYNTSLLIT
jgi:hypothetical protein